MKKERNNEIDLLLRRMSRRENGSMRDGEAPEQHLDVDELSSYAQNALPAAARARYTEHLAECAPCRKLVTDLSVSLGATVAAPAPVETVVGSGGLKKFLASLFSPMVLRYAVPALGLMVVAFIGFVILQQSNQKSFMAQTEVGQRRTAPLTATPKEPTATESPGAGFINPQQEPARQSDQITEPQKRAPNGESVAGDTAGTNPAPAAPVRDENAAAAPQPQPSATPEPPPPAKAAAPAGTDEQKKKEEAAKPASQPAATAQSTEVQAASKQANEPIRGFNSAKETEAARVERSKRETLPVQGRGASVGSVSTPRRAQTNKDNAETRTVSGRRFRKERGIWTDTAYDSSTEPVNVARGSEQFRALVADEPEIKKIAEQLDGEVIVVWKGRAYRIR